MHHGFARVGFDRTHKVLSQSNSLPRSPVHSSLPSPALVYFSLNRARRDREVECRLEQTQYKYYHEEVNEPGKVVELNKKKKKHADNQNKLSGYMPTGLEGFRGICRVIKGILVIRDKRELTIRQRKAGAAWLLSVWHGLYVVCVLKYYTILAQGNELRRSAAYLVLRRAAVRVLVTQGVQRSLEFNGDFYRPFSDSDIETATRTNTLEFATQPPLPLPRRRPMSASTPPILNLNLDYNEMDDDVFVSPRTDNGNDPFSNPRNMEIFGSPRNGSPRTPAGVLLSPRRERKFTFSGTSEKHWRDKGGTIDETDGIFRSFMRNDADEPAEAASARRASYTPLTKLRTAIPLMCATKPPLHEIDDNLKSITYRVPKGNAITKYYLVRRRVLTCGLLCAPRSALFIMWHSTCCGCSRDEELLKTRLKGLRDS
ncbi:hypothetical protein EVAR_75687_1 [Eumeta japonica]|uniref:Uncharacterized protein n=1 Tax=Eumeta variegata TaxID=151549 RepID=A0A4C1W2W1_EUMVA|nr:hypothetical protein EVAR_75687_1 [Eumeta japonica]